VDERQPDQLVTYVENALTPVIDPNTGTLWWGERLDARSDLRSVDEVVEPPPEPSDGWGADVVMVDGRPVRPIGGSRRTDQRGKTATARATGKRSITRRGRSRERRTRVRRRARRASRDGPSGSSEGDPEPGASPAPLGDLEAERRTRRRVGRAWWWLP